MREDNKPYSGYRISYTWLIVQWLEQQTVNL